MTILQYYCIQGLAEIKTYAQKMQDAQVTKSLRPSFTNRIFFDEYQEVAGGTPYPAAIEAGNTARSLNIWVVSSLAVPGSIPLHMSTGQKIPKITPIRISTGVWGQ